MLLKLMEATSFSDAKPDLHFLIALLGRHFAIRDDYQNLRSDEVSKFDSSESINMAVQSGRSISSTQLTDCISTVNKRGSARIWTRENTRFP